MQAFSETIQTTVVTDRDHTVRLWKCSQLPIPATAPPRLFPGCAAWLGLEPTFLAGLRCARGRAKSKALKGEKEHTSNSKAVESSDECVCMCVCVVDSGGKRLNS